MSFESRSRRSGLTSPYALPVLAITATAGMVLLACGSGVRSGPSPATSPDPGGRPVGVAAQTVASPSADVDLRAVLNQYCVVCHNQQVLTAGLALDVVDAANPADDEQTELGRRLEDRVVPSPEDETIRSELAVQVERALDTLEEREREVLRLRFGLGTDHEHTLAEVGRRLGLSRERVRQIEARAVAKIRRRAA